ncbi:hypothetical protein DV737_g537, partial [Chaetothyriales sp. CBS 132003]
MPVEVPLRAKEAFFDPAVPALQVGSATDIRHALLAASQQRRTRRLELGCSGVAGALSGAASGVFNRNPSVVRPALLAGALSTGAQALLHAFGDVQHQSSSTETSLVDRIANYLPLKTLTDAQYESMLQEKLGKINVEIAMLDDQIGALKRREARVSSAGKSTTVTSVDGKDPGTNDSNKTNQHNETSRHNKTSKSTASRIGTKGPWPATPPDS